MKFHHAHALIGEGDLLEGLSRLDASIARLQEVVHEGGYAHPESSLNLPEDKEIRAKVADFIRRKSSARLKYILVVGIGGSNLGTKAVYDALYGYSDLLEPERFPKLIFVDTNDPEFLDKLVDFLKVNSADPAQVLVNIISKSGTTTETVVNAEVILETLSGVHSHVEQQIFVTTDEHSKLWNLAGEKGMDRFAIPKVIGGRFSVFSYVGLLPLALAGVNIQALHEGASSALHHALQRGSKNGPAVSAVALAHHVRKGKNIHDTFLFHPELESLGKWYRQLLAESIGKEYDRDNKLIHIGLTPTVSIGSTDLHSMGQLYLGGPNDKITTFVRSERRAKSQIVPKSPALPHLVQHIEGKSVDEIMHAITDGTMAAYRDRKLPYLECVFPNLHPESLAHFMQFKMCEVMFLGEILNVDAFNQPHVELYKRETHKILEGKE